MHVECEHCKNLLEMHHIKAHRRACYANPKNLKQIAAYLKASLAQVKNYKRAAFYRWAKDNKILTSISIMSGMGTKKWNHALAQLAIFCYLSGFLDFETVEVIIFIVTDGSFFLTTEKLDKLQHKPVDMYGYEATYENHYALIGAIVERAKRDLEYQQGAIDENKEPVDIQDACDFLIKFCPEVLQKFCSQGKISQDTRDFLTSKAFLTRLS